MVIFNDESGSKTVDELHAKEAENLAQIMAGKYSLPYLDLSKQPINTDALRLVPEIEARKAELAAFKLVGRQVSIIVRSPNNNEAKRLIAELAEQNYVVETYLASPASLARAWERYREISISTHAHGGLIEISAEAVVGYVKTLTTVAAVKTELNTLESGATTGVSGLLEIILAGAIKLLASDIHLEPEEASARLRYRLDGVLHDVTNVSRQTYSQILSRIKLISGLKLNIRQAAQDGRFSVRLETGDMEIGTSALPGADGGSTTAANT